VWVFTIDFTIFSLSELKAATENFSEEKKIGSGGFGDVYKVIVSVTWFVYFSIYHVGIHYLNISSTGRGRLRPYQIFFHVAVQGISN